VARANPVLIKTLIAVAALAGLGYLFVRSVQDAREEPYTIARARLQNWTVAVEDAANPAGYALSLRTRPELGAELFRQVFTRGMESLSAPAAPVVPLLLRGEYDRAFSGRLSLAALADAARAAGLESAPFEPQCVAYRRLSGPGVTQQLYFVLFDAPAFTRFRQQIAGSLDPAAGAYDPAALSPVLLVAASDAMYSRWLPLRADAEADCVARVTVQ
jgi:hypothetical protein